MIDGCSKKNGFTLVEALVVVAIMGILSGMGAMSLRGAVLNSRIKDAGINVTAFMQRAANEATRLNEKLCVKVESNKTLKLYKGDCNSTGDVVDSFSLEAANKFISSGSCGGEADVSRFTNNQVTLTPKIGVSPIPKGCFVVQYGDSDRRAVSVKSKTKFAMYYRLSYDGGTSWMDL